MKLGSSILPKIGTAAVTVALALAAGTAQASIVISQPQGPASSTDNVIFNSCNNNIISGLMVQGCLNTDHNLLVDFEGNGQETLKVDGGQAKIFSADGAFNYLKIYLDPFKTSAFELLSFNIEGTGEGRISDRLTIKWTATNGDTGSDSFGFRASGQNKFLVSAVNDLKTLKFVEISTTSSISGISFEEAKQVRIDPAALAVPEPGSLGLLGISLLSLSAVGRRKHRQ